MVETQEVRTTLVTVEVECGPRNSRRLYAGIDIAAPWGDVWGALTNYDGLSDFIPGELRPCMHVPPANSGALPFFFVYSALSLATIRRHAVAVWHLIAVF